MGRKILRITAKTVEELVERINENRDGRTAKVILDKSTPTEKDVLITLSDKKSKQVLQAINAEVKSEAKLQLEMFEDKYGIKNVHVFKDGDFIMVEGTDGQ